MKLRLLILSVVLSLPVFVAAQGLDAAKIDEAMGRSGQKSGDVYRLGFPRTDLLVSVAGVQIKPGLALGSWAAFAGNDNAAMVMGDLVLLENELTPVMKKLRAAGFDITAVHNHVLNETPRVIYLHYMGHGKSVELAKSLHAALAESKTPLDKPAPPAPTTESPAFVKTIEDTLGTKGRFAGGVLSFGIPRAGSITDHEMTFTTPQGVAEAINFQEAGTGKVATTGDFVLTAEEVNSVISALEDHDIAVTALHSHMLTEQPRLFFMHFWAVGGTESVAAGIKAALSHVAVK
ncbi:MAG TPA: DUF1259 domain-containing protein [Terriglobales bacterium]|jgi:hypothetical protein|nr:DUF1259 domain-containing protein [Terriglobales bacterium]